MANGINLVGSKNSADAARRNHRTDQRIGLLSGNSTPSCHNHHLPNPRTSPPSRQDSAPRTSIRQPSLPCVHTRTATRKVGVVPLTLCQGGGPLFSTKRVTRLPRGVARVTSGATPDRGQAASPGTTDWRRSCSAGPVRVVQFCRKVAFRGRNTPPNPIRPNVSKSNILDMECQICY